MRRAGIEDFVILEKDKQPADSWREAVDDGRIDEKDVVRQRDVDDKFASGR